MVLLKRDSVSRLLDRTVSLGLVHLISRYLAAALFYHVYTSSNSAIRYMLKLVMISNYPLCVFGVVHVYESISFEFLTIGF